MFLPLAERMVEKMVKEEKIEAEAEVSRLSTWPGGFMLSYWFTGPVKLFESLDSAFDAFGEGVCSVWQQLLFIFGQMIRFVRTLSLPCHVSEQKIQLAKFDSQTGI